MRKPTKPGELKDVRLKVWRALVEAERLMYKAAAKDDHDRVLRSVHALSQASMTYAKLFEMQELTERIEALERSQFLKRVA